MRRMLLNAPVVLLLLQPQTADPPPDDVEPETCAPCGGNDHPGVVAVRDKLQRAFTLSLIIPDCIGEHLDTCRSMETSLEEAFTALEEVMAESDHGGSIDCVACDPRPFLSPLFVSFEGLATALVERGHPEFEAKQLRMQQEIELWKGYSCCGATKERAAPSPNREMEARAVLTERCGVNFEKNRQGLRQVVRMPGDREGCFQSRACRDATQHNGQFLEAGFWTYDGEYWYIWAQRRTPRGDWIDCDP